MPEDITAFNIAGTSFPADIRELEKTRRVDDAATGKKKTEKYKTQLVYPSYPSIAAAALLFSSLCNVAEVREAGTGLKLADALLLDRLEEAHVAGINLETGHVDIEKWLLVATSPERPRSAGQSIEHINAELAELALEMAQLQVASADPKGFERLLAPDGSRLYKSMQEFVLRLNEVINRINNLSTLATQRRQVLEEKRLAREAKAAEAKARTAQAAIAAAAEAAANPIA